MVCIVQDDVEGGIGRLIVKLRDFVAEGFLFPLLLRCRWIEVGDVVECILLRKR